MKRVADFPNIYLYRVATDMRKQARGLSTLIQEEMGCDPFDEALYVFCNKRRNLLKCVYWRKTGFALWVAYLEEEKFPWPKNIEQDVILVTPQQMEWFLDGIDIWRLKRHKKLSFKKIS